MKRIALAAATLAILGIPLAQIANAEVSVNVNVGIPVVPVAVPAIPGPPQIVLSAPPEFVMPSALGFYVAVGVPYDIFYVGNTYYLYRDNGWYRAPYYNGPWRGVERRHLPPGLRKHKFERIRYYRDEEYRHYRGDHDRYRGRHFRPDKGWKQEQKENRRAVKTQWKEERRQEKDERKWEKEERKEHGRHGGRGE